LAARRALWSPLCPQPSSLSLRVVLCACAPLAPGPPPHTLAPRPSSPAFPPAHPPRPASLTPCFRLGRKRRPSISGRGSTCPAPRTWDSCSQCAPPRAYALPPEPSSHAGPPRSRRLCCRVPPALPPVCPAPPPHTSPRAHRTLPFRLGRAPPCPPPTGCSSVAHGRAPRPSTTLYLLTTSSGLREDACEARLCMCAW